MKEAILRFSGKNIPVTAVAKIMGKDQQFVRQAMIEGLLPIGVAFRKKGSSQYDFYISPKLLLLCQDLVQIKMGDFSY